jgi:hypothetical protein
MLSIPLSLGLPSGLFPSGFPTDVDYRLLNYIPTTSGCKVERLHLRVSVPKVEDHCAI